MSEYWVSHKKYFCKFCNIYIADDAPSRQQHENGLRHKGNKERFVRGLYKAGEKRKKDLDEEKLEMVRVEKAAQAAYAQDISTGHAKQSASSSGPSASSSTSKPPPKPSNPYANYSTAASLGYTDPDAEKLAAEYERRRTQGVVGDWEYVTPTTASPAQEELLKREAEQPVDDERHFKLRKKTMEVGLGELYDPGIIPVKLKKKELTPPPILPQPSEATTNLRDPKATNVPKWTKVQWKKAGEGGQDGEPTKAEESPAKVTPEDISPPPARDPPSASESIVSPSVKSEVLEEPATSLPTAGLFKKRRRPGN